MTLQLTLATNLAPGDHEIRVRALGGLSNPLKFCVGLLPGNQQAGSGKPCKERGSMDPALPATRRGDHLVLPVTLNGQIVPGGADRYHFWARQGQQLVIAVEAATHPVSGRRRAGLVRSRADDLRSQGQNAGEQERFRFKPDPVIHFEVPSNGTYAV